MRELTDFVKYQALGNDYIVVDPNLVDLPPNLDTVRLACDRHFGVGADGILLGPIGQVEPGCPVELRIFNSDGGECAKSGNGIRMFAMYLAEHYLQGDEFIIRTAAGDSRVQLRDRAAGLISIDMGRPRFDAADIPVLEAHGQMTEQPLVVDDRELLVTCVNNGNPHTVVWTDEPSRALAHELGPLIAGHRRFPNRTNVQFLRVIDRGTIQIEIWERGAGYTLASGSSGCAAASAAHAAGLLDNLVQVQMPGGQIEVELADDGAVTMTGPVEQVAIGRFAPALRARLGMAPRDPAIDRRRAAAPVAATGSMR